MQMTPIEVRLVKGSQGNFLYLNAGALSLYRMLGGTKTVDDVSESLPDAPLLGNPLVMSGAPQRSQRGYGVNRNPSISTTCATRPIAG